MILCRWKALDFASLKRSSVSFFNYDKQETAVAKWARAKTRVAKVISILRGIFVNKLTKIYGLNIKYTVSFIINFYFLF